VRTRGEEPHLVAELASRLRPGGAAFLDLNPEGEQDQRYRTVFEHWETGRFFSLERPEACRALHLERGRICAVRFMLDGEVWGFYASLDHDLLPFSDDTTIRITWPRSARRQRVRRFERVPFSTPCEAAFPDGSTEPGSILDLGAGGCRVSLHRPLELGEVIELTFEMPRTGGATRRSAAVRNRGAAPDGALVYGCQFADADEGQPDIEYHVARALAGHRAKGAAPVVVLSADEHDADLVRQALHNTGREVVAAGGVLQLGARIDQAKPAAVLISSGLSDLEAADACLLVHRTQGLGDLPVVIYGGGDTAQDQARAAGASAWIPGPAQALAVAHLFPDGGEGETG